MRLLQHLNEHGFSKEEFESRFSVNVRQEGDFYQFKYGLSPDWSNPMLRECRGVILRRLGEREFEVASRPFDKFFNRHEVHCEIHGEDAFKRMAPQLALVEKADGTCIQLWYDGKRWRASTLGTITPMGVNGEDTTFDDLFFDTAKLGFTLLNPENTYLFELCTEQNRIVTKYEKDHCVLLGTRDNVTGHYLDCSQFLLSEECNVRLPWRRRVAELALNSAQDLKSFVEQQSSDPSFGVYPEGFVVVDEGSGRPIAKLKNEDYIKLHAFGSGDLGHSKNKIVQAFFDQTLDDVRESLSPRLEAFANKLEHDVHCFLEGVMSDIELIQQEPYEDQKAYAMAVNSKISEGKIRSFCFQQKDAILKKQGVRRSLERWLQDNYSKFNWKE